MKQHAVRMGLVMLWLLGSLGLLLFVFCVVFVLFETWDLNYTTKNDVFLSLGGSLWPSGLRIVLYISSAIGNSLVALMG